MLTYGRGRSLLQCVNVRIVSVLQDGVNFDFLRGHTCPWRTSCTDQSAAATTMSNTPPGSFLSVSAVGLPTSISMAPMKATKAAASETTSIGKSAISQLKIGVKMTEHCCMKFHFFKAPVIAEVMENPYNVARLAAKPRCPIQHQRDTPARNFRLHV
jgi:hypothetical protein